MRRPGLSAAGAARRACGELAPGEAAFEAALAPVAARLPELGLEPELLQLAREVAALAPGLHPPDRLATILLVLAVLAGEQQGSARVGWEQPGLLEEVATALDASLAPLEGREPGPAAAEAAALAARARVLLASGALDALVGDAPAASGPGLLRPFVREGAWVASQAAWARERRLAVRLAARLTRAHPPCDAERLEGALAEVRQVGAFALSPAQERALATPFRGGAGGGPSGVSLIVGPPGSGKTATVAALLRLALRLALAPEEVALAAPTAKAARRMGEALAQVLAPLELTGGAASAPDARLVAAPPTPTTLHRLLGARAHRRGGFRHGPTRPLAQRLVIVDELSMLDLELADALLAALRPDALLVGLGDPEQLPAVGVGAVLAELTRADGPRVPRLEAAVCALTAVFRAGGDDAAQLLGVADALRRGDAAALLDGPPGPARLRERARAAEVTGQGVEALLLGEDADDAEATLGAFVDRWSEALGAELDPAALKATYRLEPDGTLATEHEPTLRALFAAGARRQLLAALHGGPRGVESLNGALHARHLARLALPSTHGFAVGDPLLITANDHALGLLNGDVGRLLLAAAPHDRAPRPVAVFERPGGGYAAFPPGALAGRLTLAWALTVHRAQGSEYDEVALVLPDRPIPLVTRALLYTALTRARRGAVVVGRREVLAAAIARAPRRGSGLRQALAQACT